MQKSLLLSGLCVGVLSLAPIESSAQWQPDVRLTDDAANSFTTGNNGWCISGGGDVLHAVWYDTRDGNQEIYYKRSTDGGTNWGADIRLTNSLGQSSGPSVSATDQVVHVVWWDLRDGNAEVYYKRSTDAGVTWGSDVRLTTDLATSGNPSAAVSGQTLHVAWLDNRDGNNEIYYKRSTDEGLSWGADTRLTNDPGTSNLPSIAASGSVVHVVWYDTRDGNTEVYYKGSTDGGLTWGADTRLSDLLNNSEYPSVSASGQLVDVVWHDSRDGNFEIYSKRSTNGGLSWGTDTRLTNNFSVSNFPSVSVVGQAVHVVWFDSRDGNDEVYYKRSTDAGVTWGLDARLTSDPATSSNPSVAVSGSFVHVVWRDTRDGNYEIYYKRDPTGNPAAVRIMDDTEIHEYKLFQNYPNPFNPGTTIRFSVPRAGYVTLKVINVLGEELALLVAQDLSPGTYVAQWDAAGIASGVYFYRLDADGFLELRKMVLLK